MSQRSYPCPMSGRKEHDYSLMRVAFVADAVASFSRSFIELPTYTEVLGKFDALRALGRATRGEAQRSMTVLSPSACGKSAIARIYANRARSTEPNPRKLRVVYISVGDMATTKDVLLKILENIGDGTTGTKSVLRKRIVWGFGHLGVELLILDEVHHLLSMNRPIEVVNFFKDLLNSGLVPIVFLGTGAAAPIFEQNDEMGQRIAYEASIPALDSSANDLRLYAGFLQKMDSWLTENSVFKQTSDFIDDYSLECLFAASKGHIGWTARLLQYALTDALHRHANRIEFYDLANAVDKWTLNKETAKRNPFRRKQH